MLDEAQAGIKISGRNINNFRYADDTTLMAESEEELKSLLMKVKEVWNGLRHLGDSWKGGTTLEFLSPFLWRAPPLEMRRERQEFFPEQAGKGSLISSYEAETGLLWMWAGPSCFLSSGDGYVGELLELQQGCEGPFGSSRD